MSNTTTVEGRSEGDDLPYVVRLAIPNKGRISIPILELMEKSGLHLLDAGERRLISRTPDPHIEVLFARPIDIPEYVATGAADMGITGHDMVAERGVDVDELLDLQFGRATLVLAVQEGSPVQSVNDLMDAKIATEFPGIAQSYFKEHSISRYRLSGLAGPVRRHPISVSRMQLSIFPVQVTRSGRTACE